MILGPIQIDRSCHITRKGRFSTARTPITTHGEAIHTHTLDSRHRDDEMRGTAQAPRRRRSVTGACLVLEFLLAIPSLLLSYLTFVWPAHLQYCRGMHACISTVQRRHFDCLTDRSTDIVPTFAEYCQCRRIPVPLERAEAIERVDYVTLWDMTPEIDFAEQLSI